MGIGYFSWMPIYLEYVAKFCDPVCFKLKRKSKEIVYDKPPHTLRSVEKPCTISRNTVVIIPHLIFKIFSSSAAIIDKFL